VNFDGAGGALCETAGRRCFCGESVAVMQGLEVHCVPERQRNVNSAAKSMRIVL
jgi:hypothetical protein